MSTLKDQGDPEAVELGPHPRRHQQRLYIDKLHGITYVLVGFLYLCAKIPDEQGTPKRPSEVTGVSV